MDPILDNPQKAVVDPVHLRISGWILSIELLIVLVLNVLPRFNPRTWMTDPDLKSIYLASLGFAFLVFMVLMLFGLYLIIRIWKRKEGTVLSRRLHSISQLVFFGYVVVMITRYAIREL